MKGRRNPVAKALRAQHLRAKRLRNRKKYTRKGRRIAPNEKEL
jgi:hypothetical protein